MNYLFIIIFLLLLYYYFTYEIVYFRLNANIETKMSYCMTEMV